MIELSNTSWISYDQINGCNISKGNDDCHYVTWYTDIGDILSDAFTGIIQARNYVKGIVEEIKKYEKELDA